MSWLKLTNSELQATRKILMLDVSEAAEGIGKVSNRTWQYWESGRSKVPDDVDMEIYGLVKIRNDMIDEHKKKQMECEEVGEIYKIPYYHTFEQYIADHPEHSKVNWRLHQAAVSFAFSEGGEVELT
jgi:hypothetical protein